MVLCFTGEIDYKLFIASTMLIIVIGYIFKKITDPR